MDIIFLDHDLPEQRQTYQEALNTGKEMIIVPIQEAPSLPEDAPVRAVLLTRLDSGLLAYHLKLIDGYPQVRHWIICVADHVGEAVKQTLRKQFAKEMASRDAWCEFFFDETPGLEVLRQALEKPAKTAKKLVVVSNNAALAENVGEVMGAYLPDWEIEAGKEPDYLYCDAVLAVGDAVPELCVPCPQGETVKKLFWLQVPGVKSTAWKREQIESLKGTLNNALDWNLSDYGSVTSFSSLLLERALLQLRREEIHPMALISDPHFVIWDEYGLPVPQSTWTDEGIVDFLVRNTVFPQMVDKLVCHHGPDAEKHPEASDCG